MAKTREAYGKFLNAEETVSQRRQREKKGTRERKRKMNEEGNPHERSATAETQTRAEEWQRSLTVLYDHVTGTVAERKRALSHSVTYCRP